MISDEQALKILDRLLIKSRAGQVNWQLNSGYDVRTLGDATSFVVVLPESKVELNFVSPEAEPDLIIVSFKNKNNVTVKQIVIDEDHSAWPIAKSLFDEAGRITVGWDKVFDDLENAVNGEQSVGLSPNPPVFDTPSRPNAPYRPR